MGGAASWPALSKSTGPVTRSPSESYVPSSGVSPSSSQAPLISHPPQRQVNANATANNATRPRSRNRGGGGGSRGNSSGIRPSHNIFNQQYPPPPPPFPIYEVPHGMLPSMLGSPATGNRPVAGFGVSHSHMDNDHSSQRSTPRRGNYGPRPRGDGSHHNNNGGRRGQGRRDIHQFPQQYMHAPTGYFPPPPPPPGASPFMTLPPVRPFLGQMGLDMVAPYMYIPSVPVESYRSMPIVPPPPPPPPMSFPLANENSLTNLIVKQIDYYFSDDNLAKDNFLRSKMDNHGWVSVTLIASFPRVQQLTKNIPVILDSLRYSTIVEVQGDKLRRLNEWSKWIARTSVGSGPQSPNAAPENGLTNANGEEGHTETTYGEDTNEE